MPRRPTARRPTAVMERAVVGDREKLRQVVVVDGDRGSVRRRADAFVRRRRRARARERLELGERTIEDVVIRLVADAGDRRADVLEERPRLPRMRKLRALDVDPVGNPERVGLEHVSVVLIPGPVRGVDDRRSTGLLLRPGDPGRNHVRLDAAGLDVDDRQGDRLSRTRRASRNSSPWAAPLPGTM